MVRIRIRISVRIWIHTRKQQLQVILFSYLKKSKKSNILTPRIRDRSGTVLFFLRSDPDPLFIKWSGSATLPNRTAAERLLVPGFCPPPPDTRLTIILSLEAAPFKTLKRKVYLLPRWLETMVDANGRSFDTILTSVWSELIFAGSASNVAIGWNDDIYQIYRKEIPELSCLGNTLSFNCLCLLRDLRTS